MPSRIVKVEVSRRGPQGSISPADQARIDAAIAAAETISTTVADALADAEGVPHDFVTNYEQAKQ